MSETKRKVTEWSLTFECDHAQYWQGHGIACTNYTDCATGCGNTLREALEDALEGLAQQDIGLTDEQEEEITAELAARIARPYNLDTDISIECDALGEHKITCGCAEGSDDCPMCHGDGEIDDPDPDCAICAGEWHYYVNIDVVAE